MGETMTEEQVGPPPLGAFPEPRKAEAPPSQDLPVAPRLLPGHPVRREAGGHQNQQALVAETLSLGEVGASIPSRRRLCCSPRWLDRHSGRWVGIDPCGPCQGGLSS